MSNSMIERAARALCKLDGHPENTMFEGEPMWRSYVPQARAVLWAIQDIDNPAHPVLMEGHCTPGDWKRMISAMLAE